MNEPKQAALHRKKMRGGLGRTLLTAFLLLTISPLSVMSVYAIDRTRQESREYQEQQMLLLAESYRAQLLVAVQQLEAALEREESAPRWVLDEAGQPVGEEPLPSWLDPSLPLQQWQVGGEHALLWVVVPQGERWVASLLPIDPVLRQLNVPESMAGNVAYLHDGASFLPISSAAPPLPGLLPRLLQQQSDFSTAGAGHLKTEQGMTLYSYVPLIEGLTLLVIQPEEVRGATDGLAAALVATAILTALVTTVGAAFITRRITRPLYELTRTAVQITRGDLTRRAQVDQDNELGIMALAFNIMTGQLQETLETLEERVEQRTEELRQANAKIQARARQLELSAEIGAVISAIHDLEQLLEQGTRLIASAFGYNDVAIWLITRQSGQEPQLRLGASIQPVPDILVNGNGSGPRKAELAIQALEQGAAVFSEDRRELAMPLRIADNRLGSLVLRHEIPFEEGDEQHLQTLADSVTVAIENARASELERRALEKLSQIEQHRAKFLGQMSVELTTALNSIIGFSHLMLKEVEGPLTDMQRSDLTYINRNGTHLLSLLDGLLDVMDSGSGQWQEGNVPSLGENNA